MNGAETGSPGSGTGRNGNSLWQGLWLKLSFKLWSETAIVLTAGVLLALLANRLSPHGLQLGRDYFPKSAKAPGPAAQPDPDRPARVVAGIPAAVAARLQERGLQPIAHEEVTRLWRAPDYGKGIVFVDARDDGHYRAGHIPGAYQFNSYEMEKYFPTILPVCLGATQVVVYCNGGDCEDSEFAAITLGQAGVPLSRLAVYTGGMSEWAGDRLPLELDDRNSGRMKPATP